MKIILDDTNQNDVKLMQVLGSIMTRMAQGEGVQHQKPVVKAVPDEPEAEEPEAEEPRPDEPEAELDSNGDPWDPKLHASTRTKNADGTWKKRKKIKKSASLAPETSEPETPKPPAVAPAAEPAVSAPSLMDVKAALDQHKGNFGIDRTREIVQEATGKTHPSEVPESDYATLIDALKSDKGPKSEAVDLSDFC